MISVFVSLRQSLTAKLELAAEAADLVYVSADACFKWEGDKRAMDPAKWEPFLLKTSGKVSGEDTSWTTIS